MVDPELRREYDALEEEFSLISQAITVRTRAGKTQTQIAEIMGISQPAVAKIDAGKVKNLNTLKRNADAIGCRIHLELKPI